MAIDKISALLRVPALSTLPRSLIHQLAEASGIQRIGKGSALFHEGERAHFVYALIQGRVSLISGTGGHETIADFVEVGEVILVPPALLGLSYMVTAKAVTNVLVILMPAESFCRIARTELALSVALNQMLASHWRLLLQQVTQTKTRGAETRLVKYLIDSAGVVEGAVQIALPGSKKELAAHLGITPETLSRSLKRLGPLGVKTKGRKIRIDNVSRLNNTLQHPDRAARH